MTVEDLSGAYKPVSEVAQFSHYYVEPLNSCKGKNDRIVLGKCLAHVDVQDGVGKTQKVIHAASHNYAGFYRSCSRSESLQRHCLDDLPISTTYGMPALEATVHEEIARIFDADFCYTTSTGYGSNLLAFSAILDSSWFLVMDEKCHNSMHVGVFLGKAGLVRKFGHNDLKQLENILREHEGRYANVMVAVEGFYRHVSLLFQSSLNSH